jgi:hypothetical protein
MKFLNGLTQKFRNSFFIITNNNNKQQQTTTKQQQNNNSEASHVHNYHLQSYNSASDELIESLTAFKSNAANASIMSLIQVLEFQMIVNRFVFKSWPSEVDLNGIVYSLTHLGIQSRFVNNMTHGACSPQSPTKPKSRRQSAISSVHSYHSLSDVNSTTMSRDKDNMYMPSSPSISAPGSPLVTFTKTPENMNNDVTMNNTKTNTTIQFMQHTLLIMRMKVQVYLLIQIFTNLKVFLSFRDLHPLNYKKKKP